MSTDLKSIQWFYVISVDDNDHDDIRFKLEWHKCKWNNGNYNKSECIKEIDSFHTKQAAIDHAVLLALKSEQCIYFQTKNGTMELIFDPDSKDFEVAYVVIGKVFEYEQRDITLQEAKQLCQQLNQDHGETTPGHYMIFWKHQ